jgi:FK506-binding protein 6
MAFGELGVPPRIPGDATILYIVEIMKMFNETALASFDMLSFEERQAMPFEEILEKCNSERTSGNAYLKDGKHKDARIRYDRAIKILEDRMVSNGDQEKEVKQLLVKLYCNSAHVLNEMRKHYAASTFCKKALAIDPKCIKALYHYGKASIDNGNYDMAKKWLLQARAMKPNNAEISQQLARLDGRLKNDTISSAELERRMAGAFKK